MQKYKPSIKTLKLLIPDPGSVDFSTQTFYRNISSGHFIALHKNKISPFFQHEMNNYAVVTECNRVIGSTKKVWRLCIKRKEKYNQIKKKNINTYSPGGSVGWCQSWKKDGKDYVIWLQTRINQTFYDGPNKSFSTKKASKYRWDCPKTEFSAGFCESTYWESREGMNVSSEL